MDHGLCGHVLRSLVSALQVSAAHHRQSAVVALFWYILGDWLLRVGDMVAVGPSFNMRVVRGRNQDPKISSLRFQCGIEPHRPFTTDTIHPSALLRGSITAVLFSEERAWVHGVAPLCYTRHSVRAYVSHGESAVFSPPRYSSSVSLLTSLVSHDLRIPRWMYGGGAIACIPYSNRLYRRYCFPRV